MCGQWRLNCAGKISFSTDLNDKISQLFNSKYRFQRAMRTFILKVWKAYRCKRWMKCNWNAMNFLCLYFDSHDLRSICAMPFSQTKFAIDRERESYQRILRRYCDLNIRCVFFPVYLLSFAWWKQDHWTVSNVRTPSMEL